MKPEMEEYLESIGITQPIKDRIGLLLDNSKLLTDEEVVDIFITEYLMEDGTRHYENFRAWTDNYKILVENFRTESEFVISSTITHNQGNVSRNCVTLTTSRSWQKRLRENSGARSASLRGYSSRNSSRTFLIA